MRRRKTAIPDALGYHLRNDLRRRYPNHQVKNKSKAGWPNLHPPGIEESASLRRSLHPARSPGECKNVLSDSEGHEPTRFCTELDAQCAGESAILSHLYNRPLTQPPAPATNTAGISSPLGIASSKGEGASLRRSHDLCARQYIPLRTSTGLSSGKSIVS